MPWQKINDALIRLWDALEPFSETVGEGLLWLWENVLTPLGTWTMNELVPAFLELLASALDVVNIAINNFKPVAKWLWDKFLEPIAKWTGGVIIGVLKSFKIILDDIATAFEKYPEISNTLVGIGIAIVTLTKVIPALIGVFSGLNPVVALITVVIGVLGELYMLIFHYDEVSEMFPKWFEFWEASVKPCTIMYKKLKRNSWNGTEL